MRTRRFISAILLLGLVLSCVKEQGPEIGSNDIELKAKVGRVQLSTKGDGVLGPDYAGKMYLGLMRIDEHDAIYPGEGFKATAAMGPLTATMEGADLIKPITFNEVYQTFNNDKDGVKYASWYPWYKLSSEEASGSWKFNKTDAVVTYPDIDGSTDILYGTVTEGRRNKDFSTIEFNHALCKFRIQAYAMEAYDANGDRLTNTIDNWGAIEDITITKLPSECYIALPSSGTSSKYTISYSTTPLVKDFELSQILGLAENEPILDKLSEGWSNKKVLGQFMAPPPSDGVLRLEIKTANKSASQGITIARDFKAGHHYDVVLRFSDHGLINCTVEVGEWNYDPDPIEEVTTGEIFYDLGADETANCYMVSSSNYNYSFQATVKGNGDMGAYNGQDINLSPNYVDVIWMDSSLKDSFKLMSNNLSEGRVIFSVKNPDLVNELGQATGHALKAKGNVLIGVYTDAAKSQLLWTWHLWITDKPGEQSYNNGFVVQDRNLGATAMQNAGGDDSDGLYYQWGRPTPFPMRNTLSSHISLTVNPGGVKDGTVETAISNPTYFYENGAFDETGARKRLWGWTSEHDEYSKTIYDPCPPGYRVSSNKIWTEIDFSDTRNNLPGDTHTHEFLMTPKSGTTLYYPMSGVYRVVDGTLTPYYYWSGAVGTIPDEAGAFLWTSSYNEVSDQAYFMRLLQKNSAGSLSLEVSSNNNSPLRGSALPVRCVKESSKAHVINLSEAQTANSYIISSPGYYKFNASVKGNGVGELVGYDGSTSLDIREGSPVSIKSELDHVDFLWWQGDLADGNQLDPVNNIALINGGKPDADGFVKFSVTELPKGNLIMAAYDGRGKILWSWHFWFTDEPKLMKCHDYVIMDRFLGATYAPPKDHTAALSEVSSISDANLAASMGFYYQWGRKDPFPGPSLSSLSSNATTTTFNSWWKYEGGSWVEKTSLEAVADGDNQSISSITAAPTMFSSCDETYPDLTVHTLGSDFSEEKNWASRAVTISNTTVSEALWGYYSAGGFGLTTSKTIYDPCPPGYVVCYYLLWRTADMSGNDYYSSHDYSWFAVDPSYPEAIANNGFLFDPNRFAGAGFDSIWYPFTGYLDPQVHSSQTKPTFKQVRLQGQFFSSTPAGKGGRSFLYNTTGTGNIMTVPKRYIGVPTSFGFPIRCQKQ